MYVENIEKCVKSSNCKSADVTPMFDDINRLGANALSTCVPNVFETGLPSVSSSTGMSAVLFL